MDEPYQIQYVGQALIHSYCTEHMLPWIIAEINLGRRTSEVLLSLSATGIDVTRKFLSEVVSDCTQKNGASTEPDEGVDEDLMSFVNVDDSMCQGNGNDADINSNNVEHPHETLFHFEYSTIVSSTIVNCKQLPHFAILTRKARDAPIFCHAFKGLTRDLLDSTCAAVKSRIMQEKKNGIPCYFGKLGISDGRDDDDNDAVRFEVMLMGIVNIKNPDPPHTLIDEAVEQFNEKYAQIEQRQAAAQGEHNSTSLNRRQWTAPDFTSTGPSANSFMDDSREGSIQMLQNMRKRCNSVENHQQKPAVRRRQRHCSEPSTHTNNLYRNRIRLFQIGRDSLKMICPNKANRTLQVEFSNISRCMQGIKQREYFGIIANKVEYAKAKCPQENGGNNANAQNHSLNGEKKIIVYVLRCTEDYVCEEIMQGIKQAFATCVNSASPMRDFDLLCKELAIATPSDALSIAKQKMRDLSESEIKCIKGQLLEINPKNPEDKLAAVMAALRQLHEVKHIEHVSQMKTSEQFENQTTVNSNKPVAKKFDTIKNRAMTSFGSLLQKGKKKMQELQLDAEHLSEQLSEKNLSPVQKLKFFSDSASNSAPNTPQKNTSDPDLGDGVVRRKRSTSLGSKPSSGVFTNQLCEPPTLFYRSIFNSIVNTGSSNKRGLSLDVTSCRSMVFSKPNVRYDTPNDIRQAWKWAIQQQVLINKIKSIKSQDCRLVSQNQSDVVDLRNVPADMVDVWNELFDLSMEHDGGFDDKLLKAAVEKGIPSDYRGRVWKLLRQSRYPGILNGSKAVKKSYTEQLENLTPFQHAILIDIGRTFPAHPMYRQQLGPGQLSLFNVLKAYSLFDEEVGYCQGLSFIAGVLLMHTFVENEAYELLYSLMHEIGCRTMYLPDMKGMKLAIYKMTRLLHDYEQEVFDFFENHEVSMMLVATPWFLTMFASTFPMNFVTRVFDMVFVEGTSAIFKVALCLLQAHKTDFMELKDFEEVVNYIRTVIPESSSEELQNIINKAMALDLGSHLEEYGVEYRVLQDDIPIGIRIAENQKNMEDQIHCLESVNNKVTESNCSLLQQLQDAQQKVALLQKQLKDAARSARQSYYYT